MELSRGEILYNQAVEKYNKLLGRYQALQKELAEAKAEALGWKRQFLALQPEEKTAAK